MATAKLDMEKLVSLCRRRGFIFQSSEIYGGINGFWDYGPLGVELKKNIKRDAFGDTAEGALHIYLSGLGSKDQVIEANRKKLEKLSKASGATSQAIITALTYLEIPEAARVKVPCPACEQVGQLTEPRAFNLMFQTYVGAIQSDENIAYLRPETAQGIFANFRNVLDSSRVKLPFGIAQVGKAFRNEINPRNYTFRSREFEQMEIEFFCHPAESMKWYEYWRDLRKKWYSTLGIKSDNLKPREQGKEELAHYSIGTTDIEYMFPFSEEPQELEGVAHRGAFDLSAHMKASGKDLTYFDEDAWNRDSVGRSTNSFKEWLKSSPPKEDVEKYQYTPHVIEPSAGADRFTLAVLCEAYTEDKQPDAKGNMEERLVMRFHPRLAPVKAAVFPLVKKDGMPEKAQALYRELKKHFKVEYDDAGAVGRRYRRQDEIGTPFCITIDGDTLKDDTVTIRDRDTLQQRRVASKDVLEEIRKALS